MSLPKRDIDRRATPDLIEQAYAGLAATDSAELEQIVRTLSRSPYRMAADSARLVAAKRVLSDRREVKA